MIGYLIKIVKLLEEISQKLDDTNGKQNTGVKVNMVRPKVINRMRGIRR